MADTRIERIWADRDGQNALTELFRYKNTGKSEGSRYFLRRQIKISATHFDLFRKMIENTKSKQVQECVLAPSQFPFSTLTFEQDYASIDSAEFQRFLSEDRIIQTFFKISFALALLEENFMYYNTMNVSFIKIYANKENNADLRVTHPFYIDGFVDEVTRDIVPFIDPLLTQGLTLRMISEFVGKDNNLGIKDDQIELIERLREAIRTKKRKEFFDFVFGIFLLIAPNKQDHYLQDPRLFNYRINKDLPKMNISLQLREFFGLILTQQDMKKLPTFRSFVNKFIKMNQPTSTDFDSSLFSIVKILSKRLRSDLGIKAVLIPGSQTQLYSFEEVRKDPHAFSDISFGPNQASNPFKSQSPVQTVSRPLPQPQRQVVTTSYSSIQKTTFAQPPTTNLSFPLPDSNVFDNHTPGNISVSLTSQPEAQLISDEKVYGIRVRRYSPSPGNTPQRRSLSPTVYVSNDPRTSGVNKIAYRASDRALANSNYNGPEGGLGLGGNNLGGNQMREGNRLSLEFERNLSLKTANDVQSKFLSAQNNNLQNFSSLRTLEPNSTSSPFSSNKDINDGTNQMYHSSFEQGERGHTPDKLKSALRVGGKSPTNKKRGVKFTQDF